MSIYIPKLRNLDKVKRKIDRIKWGYKGVAVEAFAEWMIGTPARGLKHYPPKPAGSKYVRTFNLRNAWEKVGIGTNTRIRNLMSYAGFVQGDKTQAWMHVGRWRIVSQVMADNFKGAIRHAQAAVNKLIKANS
jgi:hypothetical protein